MLVPTSQMAYEKTREEMKGCPKLYRGGEENDYEALFSIVISNDGTSMPEMIAYREDGKYYIDDIIQELIDLGL